jgi:hypothetical protein
MSTAPSKRKTHLLAQVIGLTLLVSNTATTAPATALTPTPITQPIAILGIFATNQTLSIPDLNDETIEVAYQWQADDADLLNEISQTFTTDVSLASKSISVELTLTKPGYSATEIEIEAPSTIMDFAFDPRGSNEPFCRELKPFDMTEPLVGWNISMYCQDLNSSLGSNTTRQFTYYRNVTEVQRSTSSLYRLADADVGQSVSAVYLNTWSNGLQWQWQETLSQEVLPLVTLSKPQIVGSQELNQEIQVSIPNLEPFAALTYQWYRDYWPVTGATAENYVITADDLDARIQVLVTAEVENKSPQSRISDPLTLEIQTDALDVIAEVADRIPVEILETEIEYIRTENYPLDKFERNQALLDRAATFWSDEFQPENALAVYFAPSEVEWADAYFDERFPQTSINLQNQLTNYGCGFAAAMYIQPQDTYLFYQCGEAEEIDHLISRHVTPHEYTHWVQYSYQPNLYLYNTPWLIEGQGNFYGLAIASEAELPDIDMINWHLAHQAMNFDAHMKAPHGTLTLLDILVSGNLPEVELLLRRGGAVHEQYLLGHLMTEFLVSQFGHDKYWDWASSRIIAKTNNRTTDLEILRALTLQELGFEWDAIYKAAVPYLSMRALEIKNHWLEQNAPKDPPNPVSQFTATAQANAVELRWSENGDNGSSILDYEISWGSNKQVCTKSPCLISNLTNGKSESFRVRARNINGYSDWSNQISATPFDKPTPPNRVSTKRDKKGAIKLRLIGINENGKSLQKIEYALKTLGAKKFGGWKSVGTSKSFTLRNLRSKAKYVIRIRVQNAAGASVSKDFRVSV